jgi:hypothetical protein
MNKLNFLSITLKRFSKGVVIFPPKLKTKNLPKLTDKKKKKSPIYNLLTSKKLVNSPNEIQNLTEKQDYENLIEKSAEGMLFNSLKLTENKSSADMKNLYDFISKNLKLNDSNDFIGHLSEVRKIFNSEEVEKTKDIFKLFLDKIYSLSDSKGNFKNNIIFLHNKVTNEYLIRLLAKVSINDIYPEQIFEKEEFPMPKAENQMQASIAYSQYESNFENFVDSFADPKTNDIELPEKNFKDVQYNYYIF